MNTSIAISGAYGGRSPAVVALFNTNTKVSTHVAKRALETVPNQQIAQLLRKLDDASCVSDFRCAARELLTLDPRQVNTVHEKATRLEKSPGGRHLLEVMTELTSSLVNVPKGRMEQFLRRALRSSGATTVFIRELRRKKS